MRFILAKSPKSPEISVPEEYKTAANIAWYLHYEVGMSLYPLIAEAKFPDEEEKSETRSESDSDFSKNLF
ncbi:MAG: hypothetical protein Q4C95_08990 [Planctomycetia bacterium]|nr:hypothetical protein [Planctomycetia bacterium]